MEHKKRKIVIIAGSNRTGTSLLTEVLIENGFTLPDGPRETDWRGYDVHEPKEFKELSRRWNDAAARDFVRRLDGERIVLKYPKASRVLHKWLRLIPDAHVIYVYRPCEEAVESQLRNWWRWPRLELLGRWIYRWEWRQGILAMSNLQVPVCFITFRELQASRRFVPPADWGWDKHAYDCADRK